MPKPLVFYPSMHCVIGSGPSGIACALGLLQQGHEVTLVDGGNQLESDKRALLSTLSEKKPQDWDQASLSTYQGQLNSNLGGVPLKLASGSSYPYDTPSSLPSELQRRQADLLPSYGRGGLSAVWGASILPYRDADLGSWPISTDDLKPHYRAVLDGMGFSGRSDSLASLLPLYSDQHRPLPMSRQAAVLHQKFSHHETELSRQGLQLGQSRLAIQQKNMACQSCGLCMHGCPYGLIYNSQSSVEFLKKTYPRFHYRPGALVQRFQETAGGVTVCFADGSSLQAVKLFVAAGVIPTAEIVLRSLEAYDHPVSISDSQYFLSPILMTERVRGASTESLHTLAQLFIEIQDAALSSKGIHLQLYTYNDLYWGPFKRLAGPLFPWAKPILRPWIERLLVIQGYLHSDESGKMLLRLKKQSGHKDSLEITGEPNPQSRVVIRQTLRKLRSLKKQLGISPGPLTPLLTSIGNPGRGFHSGGSFPMRKNPKPWECTTDGRLSQLKHVHLVDASVFPSIPATTITLTAMANAHRIGSIVGAATK